MFTQAMVVMTCLMLCWAGVADAQNANAKNAKNARQRAGEHARRGKLYEKHGKHVEAIAQFRQAYSLAPHPAMFYNIALNYRAAGQLALAITNYEKYLSVVPQGRRASRARVVLIQLRKKLATQDAANERKRTKRAGQERANKRRADEARRASKVSPLANTKQVEATRNLELTRTTRARNGGTLKLAGYVTTGVGVLGLVLGLKSGLDASSIADEVSRESAEPWTEAELNRQADGKDAQTRQIVFTSLGLAAIIGGAVLVVLGRNAAKRGESLALSPRLTRDHLGWSLAGRF